MGRHCALAQNTRTIQTGEDYWRKGRVEEIDMKVRQLLFLTVAMLLIAGRPSFSQGANEPHVRIATVEIDPIRSEVYLVGLKERIEATLRNEAGVVALHSVADKENPAYITVFENYRDAEACKQHVDAFQKIQDRD